MQQLDMCEVKREGKGGEMLECLEKESESKACTLWTRGGFGLEGLAAFNFKPSVGTWLTQLRNPVASGAQDALTKTKVMVSEVANCVGVQGELQVCMEGTVAFHLMPSVGTWLLQPRCPTISSKTREALPELPATTDKATEDACVHEGPKAKSVSASKEHMISVLPSDIGLEVQSGTVSEPVAANKLEDIMDIPGMLPEPAPAQQQVPTIVATAADATGGESPLSEASPNHSLEKHGVPSDKTEPTPPLSLMPEPLPPATPANYIEGTTRAVGASGTQELSPHAETHSGLMKPGRAPEPLFGAAAQLPPNAGAQLADRTETAVAAEATAPEPLGPEATLFRVQVPCPYPGVQYRLSKDLADRSKKFAENGLTFLGVLEGNGEWVRLADGKFLPVRVGAITVLSPVEVPESLPTSQQRKGERPSNAWWMWCSACHAQTGVNNELVFPEAAESAAQ